MSKLFVLTGPTAVGKSELALSLAQTFHTGIIGCDSMQIYQDMNIGTAKPDRQEREMLPHDLIDFLSPKEQFSAAAYAQAFEQVIAQKYAHKIPVVTGGTGLYIQAVLFPFAFSDCADNRVLREELYALAEKEGGESVHKILAECDPETAAILHKNDVRRVVRAIEIVKTTGVKKSQQISAFEQKPRYEYRLFVLMRPRDELYERINRRVDKMMAAGLLEEVETLLKAGVDERALSMNAIGYKELLSYLRGESSLSDAVELIKKRSRNYAKRQITFFKKLPQAVFLDADTASDIVMEEYRRLAQE